MSNEWIKWEGGECPVGRDKSVFLKFANGKDGFFFRATDIDWDHYGAASDIVAYRLYCEDDTGSFSEHVTHNDQCNCDGCTNGDDDYPEFLRNPMNDDGLTDHELDEPSDGIPEELALNEAFEREVAARRRIEDIEKEMPPVLRPATETMTEKEDSMDDLERLAGELHKAPDDAEYGCTHSLICIQWPSNQVPCSSCISIDKIKAKRDDLSGKPTEWVNDWARWRGQNNSGQWYEFSIKPEVGNNAWVFEFDTVFEFVSEGEAIGDWRDTLEERVVEVCVSKSDQSDIQIYLSIADEKQPTWNGEDKAAEWDGEGLPPVGIEAVCSYTKEKHPIVAHDLTTYPTMALTCDNSGYWGADKHHWSPIKTPKEKAIEEMLALDPYDPCSAPLTSRSQFCEMLYDAGYKK